MERWRDAGRDLRAINFYILVYMENSNITPGYKNGICLIYRGSQPV